MPIHREAAVWGAFCADALALGAHWIYDTSVIAAHFKNWPQYQDPHPDTFHPGKKAGDFTHYGDQTFWLLTSISKKGRFDPVHFRQFWQAQWKHYDGYLDQATKQTLQNIATGRPLSQSGSPSEDLGGAVRIAPIIMAHGDDLETMILCARQQTALTHNHPDVVMASEWIVRLVWQMQQEEIITAISTTTDSHFQDTPLSKWVEQGLSSKSWETPMAIARFGASCSTRNAFPGMVHLLAKYGTDIDIGLVANAQAGGDSASRGMAVGTILGAHLGSAHLPAGWIEGLSQKTGIKSLIAQWKTHRT